MYIPPKKGKKHILRLISAILEHNPTTPRTDLAAAMNYVSRVTKRKSIVFVLSDFVSPSFEQALTILARRHDVIPATVFDLRRAGPRARAAAAGTRPSSTASSRGSSAADCS